MHKRGPYKNSFASKLFDIDPCVVSDAFSKCVSMSEVIDMLKLPKNGSSHPVLKRYVEAYNICTSHFNPYKKGGDVCAKKHPFNPLKHLVLQKKKKSTSHLLRCLLLIGREEKCVHCGIGPTWNNKDLRLHVDHKDGNSLDSRPENLDIVCPNCHSQTSTYTGRNIGRYS